MLNKVIPIIYSVNNHYAPYFYISLKSLIEHANGKNRYQIYILYTELDERHRRYLGKLKRENIQIECIDIAENMRNITIDGNNYLTVETCYRLLLPQIFPQHERVLYIDSDTLVMSDVEELFDSWLGEKPVGAMHEADTVYLREYYRKLGVHEAFNAGILVIDIKLFREMNIGTQCLTLLEEDSKRKERRLQYMDQDALNIVLKDKVCFLDSRWNFLSRYMQDIELLYEERREEYLKNADDIKILHYVSEIKPWIYPEVKLADLFWKAASETPYYEEIIMENLGEKDKAQSPLFRRFQFPLSKVPRNSRVALYGAGAVGRTIEAQNRILNYVNIVLWVDKNYKNLQMVSENIYGIERLWEQENLYDYVLVAIDNPEISLAAKEEIHRNGVPLEKIRLSRY